MEITSVSSAETKALEETGPYIVDTSLAKYRCLQVTLFGFLINQIDSSSHSK